MRTDQLNFVRDEALKIPQLMAFRPTAHLSDGLGGFLHYIRPALAYVWRRPTVLLLSISQFASVVLGYVLWVQFFSLFPAEQSRDDLIGVLLVVWSIGIIGLVSLPLGLASGAMGVSQYLLSQGQKASLSQCVLISLRSYRDLWLFSWIDGLVTMSTIVSRLPSKDRRGPTITQRVAWELAYFGWKAATLGLIPSLLNGRDVISAGKESLGLLRKRFKDVVFLRLGYSILSWFIAIISYILTVYLVGKGSFFPVDLKGSGLYYFFVYATIPIALSVAVVTIILRPIYVLASFNIYSEYVKVESIPIAGQQPGSMLVQAVLWMTLLLLVLAGVFVFALQVLG